MSVVVDHHIYQYYVKVVPTKVNTRYARADTYQFSVTERVSDNGEVRLSDYFSMDYYLFKGMCQVYFGDDGTTANRRIVDRILFSVIFLE